MKAHATKLPVDSCSADVKARGLVDVCSYVVITVFGDPAL